MSLTTRIERLEQEAGNNEQGMVVRWQFSEDTQHLHCAGQDFTRQAEESLSAFTGRVVASVNAVQAKVLWMEAAS